MQKVVRKVVQLACNPRYSSQLEILIQHVYYLPAEARHGDAIRAGDTTQKPNIGGEPTSRLSRINMHTNQ